MKRIWMILSKECLNFWNLSVMFTPANDVNKPNQNKRCSCVNTSVGREANWNKPCVTVAQRL